MSGPSVSTIKRLFAVSGNRCAFPKCNQHLVDASSGKVVGRICHVKARQPQGPRYDSSQSEEARHGFDNLLLMCPIHHDVIDDDPESYTVDRLLKMKATHESGQTPIAEPSDNVANQFIANIQGNTLTHGSIIFTQNQMGGQVAHTIQNFGPQPRRISQAAANVLLAELRKYPPDSIDLANLMNDYEGLELVNDFEQIFKLAGWNVSTAMVSVTGVVKGIYIEVPAESPARLALLNWAAQAGLKPNGVMNPNRTDVRFLVGTNA